MMHFNPNIKIRGKIKEASCLCVIQFLCQTGLPWTQLATNLRVFITDGEHSCNRWIMPYLSVHHKNCMAMVKCVLTRDIYLPGNIDLPKGAFISATLLTAHFLMSLLGPRPHVPSCVQCGIFPWDPEKVSLRGHVLSHPLPWHINHAGWLISFHRSIMMSPGRRAGSVLPLTLRLLVTPNTGLKLMGRNHRRGAVPLAILWLYLVIVTLPLCILWYALDIDSTFNFWKW